MKSRSPNLGSTDMGVSPDQLGRRRGFAENLEHLHSIGMQGWGEFGLAFKLIRHVPAKHQRRLSHLFG